MLVLQALDDSYNGKVSVRIGADITQLSTTFPCKQGDTLQVRVDGGKACVIGVIGRGDEMQEEINSNTQANIYNNSNIEFIALMTDIDIGNNDPDNEEQYSLAAIIAKKNFEAGLGGIQRINMLLQAGKITDEEYTGIVGENNNNKGATNGK